MPSTDYTNTNLTIIQMVRNRLQFLAAGDPVDQQIKDLVLEMMAELEPCLKVTEIDWLNTQSNTEDSTPPWPTVPDPTKLGHEEFYTVSMQSLIADLVACYVLMWVAASNTAAGGSGAGAGSTFLKRAKADVVEVEWGQLDAAVAGGLSSLRLDTTGLIKYYQESATRKAKKLGCELQVCDPCAGGNQPFSTVSFGAMPFIVVSSCGCS